LKLFVKIPISQAFCLFYLFYCLLFEFHCKWSLGCVFCKNIKNLEQLLDSNAVGSMNMVNISPQRYTHKTSGFKTSGFKTSGFKTSGFKTSGFKTSETSGLQNIRFTKCQVYKMSGLQNVRSSKRPVAKKHPCVFCTCGWLTSAGSVAAMFAGKVIPVFYSLF
jgi:hypothetical protein